MKKSFFKKINTQIGVTHLLLLIAMVGVIAFIFLSSTAEFKNKLLSTLFPKPKSQAATTDFGYLSNVLLLGQKNISQTARNKITGNKVYHAAGVVVDRSSTPNKVYVADTGNNRVLGFNGVGYCNNQPTLSCTVDSDCGSGDSCKVDGSKGADIVFGQPNFESGSCNRDNNVGIFGQSAADKLCFLSLPTNTNIAEAWIKVNFDVDSTGNLYIPDIANNRVLKFNQPFSSDKTGGKGDTLADFVVGQTDFTGVNPNQGTTYSGPLKAPDNKSLNFTNGPSEATGRGVSVDPQGNIWVGDALNNRVMRFPPNSKIADLVLGLTDFNTTPGCSFYQLNKFCNPHLAKIRPETGQLYVLDEFKDSTTQAFSGRLLIFNPPFSNGMSASKVVVPKDASWTASPYEFFHGMGFEFNPYRVGNLANGVLWIRDGGKRLLLIDDDGNVLKTINSKDKNSPGGDQAYAGCPYNIYDQNYLMNWDSGGSIGFDKDNNIYLTDDLFHRVSRYNLPTYSFVNINGVLCPPKPNGGIFKGFGANTQSRDSLGEAIGLTAINNQLIVQDEKRIKVWNDYSTKPTGAAADYEITGGLSNASLRSNAIDDFNRLWTMNENGRLRIYQLPFTQDNQQPVKDSINLYWGDDQSLINYSGFGGIAFDKVNKKMYLVDPANNRVLRISNYNDFSSGKLLSDMVIGQPNKTTTTCNHGSSSVVADGFCQPIQAKFDNQGNLYVVENTYECRYGNDRISVFMSSDLNSASGLFPMIAAKKAFAGTLTNKGPCAYGIIDQPGSPVTLAFNSKNQMVIGNDGYYGDITLRHVRQLWFYNDPLNKQIPDGYINIPMGAPGEITFDSRNRLIVQDHTWSRIWIADLNANPSLVVGFTYIPITPNSTPTPSPTPSLVNTNIALRKQVAVTSQAPYAGWENVNTVDGSRTSGAGSYGWSSEGNTTVNHLESLTVDVGLLTSINRVTLYPRSDLPGEFFPVDFTIQVSPDSINWTTVVTKTNYPKPVSGQTFDFSTQNGRFVKIEATRLRQNPSGAAEYRMQLAEVEIYYIGPAITPIPSPTPTPIARSIKVLTPNGGETLTSGSLSTITWQSNDNSYCYIYYVLPTGGVSYVTYLNASLLSYNWNVPLISATQAKIRMYCSKAGVAGYLIDESDTFFNVIRNTPTPTPTPSPIPVLSTKRVFVTKTAYNGNLGGLTGADAKCQTSANAANLGGSWKAWLSSTAESASSRLAHNQVQHKLLNGVVFADSWDGIVSMQIKSPLVIDETNQDITKVSTNLGVWTNTLYYGASGNVNGNQALACNDWSSDLSSVTGYVGLSNYINANWTSSAGNFSCQTQFRLYCFEQ